jgi:hypothetical protein
MGERRRSTGRIRGMWGKVERRKRERVKSVKRGR